MAFTQDELQSLNIIIEQKLSIQRRDLERTFEQKAQVLKRDLEQHVTTVQQDLLHTISQQLNEQHSETRETLLQRIDLQHSHTIQSLEQKLAIQHQQQSQSDKDILEHALTAQLSAFEQIVNQRPPASETQNDLSIAYLPDGHSEFDAIEIQTEIPWEELAEMVDRALEERLITLKDSFISSLQSIEQEILQQMHALHTTLAQISSTFHAESTPPTIKTSELATTQDVLQSIGRLEHLMESMQVAMTSNTSLISNSLYHHQRLPLERAHPASLSQQTSPSSTTKPSISYDQIDETQQALAEEIANEE
jgi:hypothetical protein